MGRASVSAGHRRAGRALRQKSQALVDSPLFDEEFYAAQVGVAFACRVDAARHFVEHGMRRGLPPHPLLDVRWLPDAQQGWWRAGRVHAVLRHLTGPQGLGRPWSALFDPRRLLRAVDHRNYGPEERWQLVEGFLRSLQGSTVLPTVERWARGVSWAEARKAMIETAEELHAQSQLLARRTTDTWDAATEAAWRASLDEAATVPTSSTAAPAAPTAPLVSVVLATWNDAATIAEAVHAVRLQQLADWELLVVDAGSTDDTPAVLRRLAADDDRIRLLASPGGSLAAARDHGLAKARGGHVAFLDAGASWRPDHLVTMIRGLRAYDARAAYAGVAIRGGDRPGYLAFRGGPEHLVVDNHVDLAACVFETGLLREVGGFTGAGAPGSAHDLVLRVARAASMELFCFLGVDRRAGEAEGDGAPRRDPTAVARALIDWDMLATRLGDRVTGRTSVVMATYQDATMTANAVFSALENAGGLDVEVVVVDNGSDVAVSLGLRSEFIGLPNVRLIRMPRNLDFATGSNLGVLHSTGDTVMFLNNDTACRPGWLAPLRERLGDPDVIAVQPLLLYPDDTVQTAGTVFPIAQGLPVHLLAGHPREDAAAVGSLSFSAVTAAATLYRAETVVGLRGFDPVYVNGMEDVDLCLRARAEHDGGWFAVDPRSVVEHRESRTPGRYRRVDDNRRVFLERWQGRLPGPEREAFEVAGFDVAHVGVDRQPYAGPRLVLVRSPRPPAYDSSGRAVPALRWSIKNSAHPGSRGDLWGDTHFCEALADALRTEGQEAVVMRHGAHDIEASKYDDVVLAVRGLDEARPQPGAINVLWVISHPDAVTPAEVRDFDLVFAASTSWARRMTARSGRLVLPLLQATDPTRFHPRTGGSLVEPEVVFVGGARLDGPRPFVMSAIAAGLEPKVWGTRWELYLTDAHYQGPFYPNHLLGNLYGSVDTVLNDVWSDMAREGFIPNRVFDAVACGARVLSPPVDGLEELFDGAVHTCTSRQELAALRTRAARDEVFPAPEEMRRIAHQVARDHSFGARARQLLDAVVALRTERGAD